MVADNETKLQLAHKLSALRNVAWDLNRRVEQEREFSSLISLIRRSSTLWLSSRTVHRESQTINALFH